MQRQRVSRNWGRWAQVALAAAALCGAAWAQSAASAAPVAVPELVAPRDLPIAAGDLLDVGVFDTPDLSGRLRVNAEGEVMLPIAGAVKVSGLTVDQAAVAVATKLRSADIVKDPHVSIYIAENATQGVTVTGEVKRPGIYPLLDGYGLLDLLSAAGGVTGSAGPVVTVTHRSDPQHPETLALDRRPGQAAPKATIEAGDTIVVSRSGVAYVVGDVRKAGGFPIEGDERLTILQVMALAGGTTKTSAQNKVHLIRRTANGREDLRISLTAIMHGKAVDMPLEDGDVIFVPSSKGKIFAYRGVDSAVALTSGLVLAGRL